jgi:ribosome-binding protein aMBF1 (putative translation factor)
MVVSADSREPLLQPIASSPLLPDHHDVTPVGDVVAANVRAERARRRWRQADLAERLGWSLTKVADVESGRRRITADQLVELCRALDVTLLRLLDGADLDDLNTLGLLG